MEELTVEWLVEEDVSQVTSDEEKKEAVAIQGPNLPMESYLDFDD